MSVCDESGKSVCGGGSDVVSFLAIVSSIAMLRRTNRPTKRLFCLGGDFEETFRVGRAWVTGKGETYIL